MFGAVTGIKEAATNGDKGVIVFTIAVSVILSLPGKQVLPLQHSIAVTVDDWNCIGIRNADMMWLNSD